MEWNEINFDLIYHSIALHNMLALKIDSAMGEGDFYDEMWNDLEDSFHHTLKEYVKDVLGENAKHFYKAFHSEAEALDWIAASTDCYLNCIDEERMIDFVSEIRLVAYLRHTKGMTVHKAA